MVHAAIQEDGRASELALSIAWHAGLTREVISSTGERLVVVFPGHWTHGHGPDFRNAMLERENGSLMTGSVELHHRASDWRRHEHHTDPAYDDVVLHVVTIDDVAETRRHDGTRIPMAILRIPDEQLRDVQLRDRSIWSQFGGEVCAPRLAAEQPARIRTLLWQLGDTRFEQRVIRFESELAVDPPADVLVPALFDAFGYARNREQMRELASRVRWRDLEPRLHHHDRRDRAQRILAILLGVGGWMPIAPAHALLGHLDPESVRTLEALWQAEACHWQSDLLPPATWNLARVRPANHPFARIATLAGILGSHGGDLLPELANAIRENVDPVVHLQGLCDHSAPPLGRERAIAIVASVVLPFLTAYARSSGDEWLEDAAIRAWAELPASSLSQPARRARQQVAGDERVGGLRQRGHQGLLYLDRHFCGPRRCYECPIARAVVADDLSRQSAPG